MPDGSAPSVGLEEVFLVHSLSGMRRFCGYLIHLAGRASFPIEITIRRHPPLRTLRQNSLLHVIVRRIARFSGHTEREVKDILKDRLIEKGAGTGDAGLDLPQTSRLSPEDKSAFIEKVLLVADELGVPTDRGSDVEQIG